MTWQHASYTVLDYIFPLAEPLSKEEEEKPKKALRDKKAALPSRDEHLDEHKGLLAEYVKSSKELLENEQGRKEGVEARLTSILGLSSIAGTVAFGGFFLGTSGISHVQPRALRWLVVGVGCYLTLQVCSALLAALQGLSRRSYDHFELSDLVASPGESASALLLRKTERTLDVLADHETQNNKKVTQMAIAHLALRNFLCGLLVFTVMAVLCATRSDGYELVDKLKQNHDLAELLRGPQGPQGAVGPKGDTAPVPCTPAAQPKQNKAHSKRGVRAPGTCDCSRLRP